jgi:hypothetical protein
VRGFGSAVGHASDGLLVTSFAVGESVLAVCGVNPRLRGKEDILG